MLEKAFVILMLPHFCVVCRKRVGKHTKLRWRILSIVSNPSAILFPMKGGPRSHFTFLKMVKFTFSFLHEDFLVQKTALCAWSSSQHFIMSRQKLVSMWVRSQIISLARI